MIFNLHFLLLFYLLFYGLFDFPTNISFFFDYFKSILHSCLLIPCSHKVIKLSLFFLNLPHFLFMKPFLLLHLLLHFIYFNNFICLLFLVFNLFNYLIFFLLQTSYSCLNLLGLVLGYLEFMFCLKN